MKISTILLLSTLLVVLCSSFAESKRQRKGHHLRNKKSHKGQRHRNGTSGIPIVASSTRPLKAGRKLKVRANRPKRDAPNPQLEMTNPELPLLSLDDALNNFAILDFSEQQNDQYVPSPSSESRKRSSPIESRTALDGVPSSDSDFWFNNNDDDLDAEETWWPSYNGYNGGGGYYRRRRPAATVVRRRWRPAGYANSWF